MRMYAILLIVASVAIALSVALPVPHASSGLQQSQASEDFYFVGGSAAQLLPSRSRRSPHWQPKKILKKVGHELGHAVVPVAVAVITKG